MSPDVYKRQSPHHQGLCAMISVFIDTFVILNLTVFAVLTTDAMSSGTVSYTHLGEE